MLIISSAKMGHGTFQAKFIPLSKLGEVEKIYVLRKEKGPIIEKVVYIQLPSVCKYFFINVFVTPILLTYYSIRLKADLILSYHLVPHAFFGFFASVVTRKPHVFGQTGSECQKLSKIFGLNQLIKIVLKNTLYILTPGSVSKQFWVDNLKIDSQKIKLLHSTIDTEVFKPVKEEQIYDFIYTGRLHKIKKIDEIIRGFKSLSEKMNNIHFCIIGDGPEMLNLVSLVRELDLVNNVHFKGFQKYPYQYLNKSKIFVMASIMEGLPVALMEAMSCEKVVITTNVGNIPFLVDDGENGFLVENGDYNNLASMMEKCLDNYNKYENIKKRARQTIIDKHSYSSAMKKWKLILSEIGNN